MSDLRDLMTTAEPWSDAGFRTAAEIRSAGDRRDRRNRGLAAATVLLVVVAVPVLLVKGREPDAAPLPAPVVSATPTPSASEPSFVGTSWLIDHARSGISQDPRATFGGTGPHLASVVIFGRNGQLQFANAFGGSGPKAAGSWISAGPVDVGSTGSARFTLTSSPQGWDQDPACTATTCAADALPYWPGVVALGRLRDVVSYAVASPEPGRAPSWAKQELLLLDASGRPLLVLYDVDS
jgi:hypothetical protein